MRRFGISMSLDSDDCPISKRQNSAFMMRPFGMVGLRKVIDLSISTAI
jgi:hypothetical protein